jgi:dienelactone hydrolase
MTDVVVNAAEPFLREELPGSDRPVEYHLAETMDGLYAPYTIRTPDDTGEFPFVFIGSGNGGGGLAWLRNRVRRFRYVTDRLLEAGYACGWARYRTEVELGYARGGRLTAETRQGMDLLNRAPLEYEDEVSILRHAAGHPRVDADRLCHLGMSHAGEMLFKLCSHYPGLLRAGVAAEPANHEFLDLQLHDVAPADEATQLRDIERLLLRDPEEVRSRIRDIDAVKQALSSFDIPVLVLGRDSDELQGIFRLSYELLAEQRDDVEWRTWEHDVHGYIYPEADDDGVTRVDAVQEEALDVIVEFLDRHTKG